MVCCQQAKYAIPSLARILLPRAYLQPLCQVCNGLWQRQHHDRIASIGGAQHQATGQGADSFEGLRRPANPTCSPQTAPSQSLLPPYPSSPPGARAPIQMWVPRLQLPSILLPFQRTPRINPAMWSMTRPPQMRVQKQLPCSTRRSPAAIVLPTQLSSTMSLIWACFFSPNMISRP